jgi:DNA cross-link repair 1B protein
MRISNTPIIVDEFQYVPGVYIYLLSHLHSDHTSGLNPSWCNGTIYCSHVTKALLIHKFHVNSQLVCSLEEDETHQIPLDTTGKVTMQLTLIDANHCPGACMFLLNGYFGTILCTGDFRFDPLMLQHRALQNVSIDHLYLDDTFLDPDYDFPARKEAGMEILNIVNRYDENTHFLIGSDALGREELFIALANTLKSLVVIVDHERLQTLSILRTMMDIPNIFTNNVSDGRITVVAKKDVNVQNIQKYRSERPTIGICASGWSLRAISEYRKFKHPWIHRVAYSLHSSFSELIQFVQFLKPCHIYSSSRHDNTNIHKYLSQYCSSTHERKTIVIPRSVRIHMESKTKKLFPTVSVSSPLARNLLKQTNVKPKGLYIAPPPSSSIQPKQCLDLPLTNEQNIVTNALQEENNKEQSLSIHLLLELMDEETEQSQHAEPIPKEKKKHLSPLPVPSNTKKLGVIFSSSPYKRKSKTARDISASSSQSLFCFSEPFNSSNDDSNSSKNQTNKRKREEPVNSPLQAEQELSDNNNNNNNNNNRKVSSLMPFHRRKKQLSKQQEMVLKLLGNKPFIVDTIDFSWNTL